MTLRKLSTLAFIGAALLLAGSSDANAITRGCRASYELVPKVGAFKTMSVANFSATGECGFTVPDRCRRRARDAAAACMSAHNQAFSSNSTPDQCIDTLSSVDGYQVTNLEVFLKKVICENYRDPGKPITIQINSLTGGDSGCGSRTKLRDITLQCPAA